jgi:inhibitor of cysteine peptidase
MSYPSFRLKIRPGVVLLWIVAWLLTGCEGRSPDLSVGIDQSGKAVQMQVGQDLVVSLPSNPSTGYTWQVDTIDPTVLQLVGGAEYQSLGPISTPRPGAGGIESFRFEAIGLGQAPLRLTYSRSFTADEEPAEIFFLQVIVR